MGKTARRRRGGRHAALGRLALALTLAGSATGWLGASRVAAGGQAAVRRPPARAQTAVTRLELDSASSRVWFDGTSTFGAFTATTSSLDGWAELAPGRQTVGGRGEVHMRGANLKTGIGLRDRHLRHELDTDRYPLVTLTVERVDTGSGTAAPGETPVVLRGSLTVKGQPHPVSIDATTTFRGDTLVVRGQAPLRFTELGMNPPSKLLGAARVHDDFVLRLDGRFLPPRS